LSVLRPTVNNSRLSEPPSPDALRRSAHHNHQFPDDELRAAFGSLAHELLNGLTVVCPLIPGIPRHTGAFNPQSSCYWGRIMNKLLKEILRTLAEAQCQIADAKRQRVNIQAADGELDEAERDLELIKKKLETLYHANVDSG
jgi:hypothetical protein